MCSPPSIRFTCCAPRGGEELRRVARVLRPGRTLSVVEAEVFADGALVAKLTATLAIVPVPGSRCAHAASALEDAGEAIRPLRRRSSEAVNGRTSWISGRAAIVHVMIEAMVGGAIGPSAEEARNRAKPGPTGD